MDFGRVKKWFAEHDPNQFKEDFKKWVKKHKSLLEASGIGSLLLGGFVGVKELMFFGVGFIILAGVFPEKEEKQK